MEFTTNEIEHMRAQLACDGFKALVRQLAGPKREIYVQLADYLGVSTNSVANYVVRPISKKHAAKLSKFALMNGVLMYPYQFYPTDQICLAWLEFDYRCDKGKHASKHIFKHWDRNMNGLKVTKEAA